VKQRFSYGGQAVIEGVLIRGRRGSALAVRRPDGTVHVEHSPLPSVSNEKLRKIPLLRGLLVLAETLILGAQALSRSAQLAVQEEAAGEELPRWAMGGMVAISLTFAISVFFILPLLAARALEGLFPNILTMNLAEGILRKAILLGYIVLIGQMKDIRRVFAYHGAEHMAVHAYEHGDPLEPQALRRYPTMHPRCGTAFLLVVAVVALVVFALLGKPPLWLGILSRILLVPVIAAISYEFIRWSGAHARNPVARLLIAPGLALQRITTRQPDDGQLEVAIAAMKGALEADGVLPQQPAPQPPEGEGRSPL